MIHIKATVLGTLYDSVPIIKSSVTMSVIEAEMPGKLPDNVILSIPHTDP